MSHFESGQPFRAPSSRRTMSASQHRALRKELLILRSDVERLEFAQAGAELRQAVTHFKWLKLLLPSFSGSPLGKSAKGVNASLNTLVSQYPLISSIVSAALARPVRSLFGAGLKPAIKWGAVALAGWGAYRVWQQVSANDPDRRDTDA
jgi:hypothetical protein